MSLTAALSGALSSLSANQSILTTISANIANANTEGYNVQSPVLNVQVANGTAIGVNLSQVSRTVDEILVGQIQTQASDNGKADLEKDYMDKIMFLFGQPGGGNDLNAKLDNFFDTLSTSAANPSDFTSQSLVVESGIQLSSFLSDSATNLIKLQFDADKEIDKTIDRINVILASIEDTNSSVSIANSQGQSSNALLDERDVLVKELSGLIDITAKEDSDGLMTIFASNGSSQFTLLNSQGGSLKMSYTPTTGTNDFLNNGTINPIEVQFLDNNDNVLLAQEFVAGGTAGSISAVDMNGKLGGLLKMRDDEIPELLGLLDNIATEMIEQFNALHNNGSSIPPQNILTGTYSSDTDTALTTISGTTMFAVLNDDGTPVTAPWSNLTKNDAGDVLMPPLTINYDDIESADGSGTITPETIQKEFNEYYNEIESYVSVGPFGNIDLRGSAATGDSPITAVDFNLEGMNLDDGAATIVVNTISVSGGDGSESVDSLNSTLTSGFSIAAGTREFEPTTFTVNFDGTNTHTISVDVTITDADGVVTDTTLTFSFDPNQAASNVRSERYPPVTATEDGTIITPTPLTSIAKMTFENSSGSTITDGSTGTMKITATASGTGIAIDESTGSIGSTNPRGVSHYFGLNDFFVESRATTANSNPNQAAGLAVTQALIDNPALFSRGQLKQSQAPTSTGANPLYTYEIGAGDSDALQSYIDMLLTPQDFAASGSLPAISTTMAEYSATITELVALRTDNATSVQSKEQLILDGLVVQQQAFSGVNVDSQLADTIIFQNAFAAAARMIRTIDELFDTLFEI
jgi:flagellar hook-associated protein 1 FlgK